MFIIPPLEFMVFKSNPITFFSITTISTASQLASTASTQPIPATRLSPKIPPSFPSRKTSIYRIICIVCLFGIPLGLICGLVATLSFWRPFTDPDGRSKSGCGPMRGSLDAIFAPDFTFGNFTISGARAIDLSWNLVVGRGLQASVAWASYQIVTGAMLRIAESVPVTFEVLVALVFSTNSLAPVGHLFTAVKSAKGFRFKANLSVFLLSAIFILALPTLMDISTGYVQNVEQNIILPNGRRFTAPHGEYYDLDYSPEIGNCIRRGLAEERLSETKGTNKGYYIDFNCPQYGTPLTQLETECVQSDGYQWGLSRPWMLAISSMFLVWGLALCGIWIDTANCSQLYRQGVDLGIWKTIIDVGEALEQVLRHHEIERGDSFLRKRVSNLRPVNYTSEFDEERSVSRLRLSSEPPAINPTKRHDLLTQLHQPLFVFRLLQMCLGIAQLSLNARGMRRAGIDQHFAMWFQFACISSIVTILVASYSLGGHIFHSIQFVWVNIALDVVVIALQLPGLINHGNWLRVHGLESYMTADVSDVTTKLMGIAVIGMTVIEIILFIKTLVLLATQLHQLHKAAADFNDQKATITSESKEITESVRKTRSKEELPDGDIAPNSNLQQGNSEDMHRETQIPLLTQPD